MTNKVSLYTSDADLTTIDFLFFDDSDTLVSTLSGELVDTLWFSPALSSLNPGDYTVVAQNGDFVYGSELLTWDGTSVIPYKTVVAKAVKEELDTELAQIISMQNGLTDAQAIMLVEIYNYLGLDPTRPLVVDLVSKKVLPEIEQTIDTNKDRTIITRIGI